tara:strand:- start:414 stop:1310 length:897 start_codon:yes stop_codon:yes gene_type:complete
MRESQSELAQWKKKIKKFRFYLKEQNIFTEGLLIKTMNTICDSGFVAHIETGTGFEMLELLMDEDQKVDCSSWVGKNQMLDVTTLHPALSNNTCWREMFPKLMSVSQKGTGEGEVVMRLILKHVQKAKDQDINASGNHIEAKVKTANLKAHGKEHQKFRQTNNAAIGCGWVDDKNKPYQGLFREENPQTIRQYIKEIYFEWPASRVDQVTREIHKLSPTEAQQHLGTEVLLDYREVDGFDLYMHFGEGARDNRVLVIGDFDDREYISENLRFRIPLRGNSTQALADGYASAQLFKEKK